MENKNRANVKEGSKYALRGAILLLLAFSTTFAGCDWVRGRLGMPTSADIQKKREQIAALQQMEKAKADSLAALQDTTVACGQGATEGAKAKAAQQPQQGTTAQVAAQQKVTAQAAVAQSAVAQTAADGSYYIVIGAFETESFVQKCIEKYKGTIDKPIVTMPNGAGLTMVAFGGYQSSAEAVAALKGAGGSISEAWIYKKRGR